MTILEPEINIDKENPVRSMAAPNQCLQCLWSLACSQSILPWSSTAPGALDVAQGVLSRAVPPGCEQEMLHAAASGRALGSWGDLPGA